MPWTLTTPVSTGDLCASDYAQVRIVKMEHDSVAKRIRLWLEYGNTTDDVWVKGLTPEGKEDNILISGSDYTSLVDHVTEDDELTYAASRRGLYEWLLSEEKIDAGSVA